MEGACNIRPRRPKPARLALLHFAVDNKTSICQSSDLLKFPENIVEMGSIVKVKINKDIFDAKIVHLCDEREEIDRYKDAYDVALNTPAKEDPPPEQPVTKPKPVKRAASFLRLYSSFLMCLISTSARH